MIEGFDDEGHPRIGRITEEAKSPGGPFTSLQQYVRFYTPQLNKLVRYMDWRIRSIVVEH